MRAAKAAAFEPATPGNLLTQTTESRNSLRLPETIWVTGRGQGGERAAGGKLVQQMENAGLRIGTLRKMTEIRAGHRLNRNLENSSLFQHEREGSASRTTVLFPEKELRIWSPIPIEISCPATLLRTVNQLAKLTNILKNERYYMERKTAPCAVLRPTGKRRKL